MRAGVKRGAQEQALSARITEAVQDYMDAGAETFLTTLLSAKFVLMKASLDLDAMYVGEYIAMTTEMHKRAIDKGMEMEDSHATDGADEQLGATAPGEAVGVRADEGREDDPVVADSADV